MLLVYLKIQYNETMLVLCLVIAICLIIVAATRPVSLELSLQEVKRRADSGLLGILDVERAHARESILVLKRLAVSVLMVLFVPAALVAFGWVAGILLSLALALIYPVSAKFRPLQKMADKLYGYYEKYLLALSGRAPWFFRLFLAPSDLASSDDDLRFNSKPELLAAIKNSQGILSKFENQLITSALDFESRLVSDIMTPRTMIDSIEHSELLGPITLSELHNTGHSRFPVIEKDIDHVVGVLYVRDLLTIDGSKNSPKVSQVMDKNVCFIREDQALVDALAAFLKTQKLLFIVINEFKETVGLLSLEDVLEAMIGKKINDEFEQHTSLRAVAERNPGKNNSPQEAKYV